MSEGNRKPERDGIDPEKLTQELEMELVLRRAVWQQTKARRGNLRTVSFAFLFLVVMGALLGGYFFLSSDNVQGLRANAAARESATPSPSPK